MSAAQFTPYGGAKVQIIPQTTKKKTQKVPFSNFLGSSDIQWGEPVFHILNSKRTFTVTDALYKGVSGVKVHF